MIDGRNQALTGVPPDNVQQKNTPAQQIMLAFCSGLCYSVSV
jgi:hypothetical protein